MIADRRAKQPRGRAAKPAVAAEHQDLCGGLVDDREWIALAVVGCDHPARKLDHRAGDLLVLRKLVDGGDRRGGSRAEARERQRQRTKKGPDRGVCAQATNRAAFGPAPFRARSEEHTSELQSLMRNSYAVFC